MPIAIGRSKPDPSFFTSAGERLTVMCRGGRKNPLLANAARTREYASRTAASGRPTSVNPGCAEYPPESTSIVIRTASIPSVAALHTFESMLLCDPAEVPHRGYLGTHRDTTRLHEDHR